MRYPARIFAPVGEAERGVGQRFESTDSRAVLSIYSRNNEGDETPATYLRTNIRVKRTDLDYLRVTRSFSALDDEQKARLLRDMTLVDPQVRSRDHAAERWERRSRRHSDADASRPGRANLWGGICEQLTAALRGWPIREIERGVRLSEAQRVAFYEFITSSLKAADTLAGACPAATALTPVGRMTTLRERLSAVRQTTAAIQPALAHFYDALDQEQKVRFAEMR